MLVVPPWESEPNCQLFLFAQQMFAIGKASADFKNKSCRQTERVATGSPRGPILANIGMTKIKWKEKC